MEERTGVNESEISVLAAPSNFILEDTYGSEYLWPSQIMKFASRHQINYTALTYWANLSQTVPHSQVVSFRKNGPPENSTMNRLRFTYLCWRKSKSILKTKKIDVLHQMSIGFGEGFNPTVLTGKPKGTKFLVGPVQAPQSFKSCDGAGVSSRNFDRKVGSGTGSFTSKATSRVSNAILNPLFSRTLKTADKIIVINELAADLCSKIVDPEKIVKIPIGVDTERFTYSPSHHMNEVLFVGFLVKRKGVDYLIRAFERVLKEVPDARLRIVGEGPQRSSLQALTEQLGIGKNVIFEGLVPNRLLPKYYDMCDVVCLPSLSESYGNVVLEAQATGRPVVASQLPALSELIAEGLSGCLTPLRDEDSLAEGLTKILTNRSLKEKMGISARKQIDEVFGWSIIGKKYAEIYRELVG
jgi:hypothetical protein